MKCLAILVNYHSADLLLQAVGSLVNGPDAGACDRICVLDNSVCALEAQRLHWAGLRRWRNWRWRTQALALWQAQKAQPVAALSGGHVLLRCTALQSAGGLFDPAFFMYWEDSDLMRRLHLAGWRLLIDPKAKAIHAYEHSEQKNALLANGWPVYERKHFSAWPWRWLDALLRHCPSAPPQPINWTRLDLRGDGVRIEIPQHLHTGWLLEIALTPDFLPACGQLGTGPELHLPAQLLRRLGGLALYLRLGPSKPDDPAACLHYQLFMAQQTGPGWSATAGQAAAPPLPDQNGYRA